MIAEARSRDKGPTHTDRKVGKSHRAAIWEDGTIGVNIGATALQHETCAAHVLRQFEICPRHVLWRDVCIRRHCVGACEMFGCTSFPVGDRDVLLRCAWPENASTAPLRRVGQRKSEVVAGRLRGFHIAQRAIRHRICPFSAPCGDCAQRSTSSPGGRKKQRTLPTGHSTTWQSG